MGSSLSVPCSHWRIRAVVVRGVSLHVSQNFHLSVIALGTGAWGWLSSPPRACLRFIHQLSSSSFLPGDFLLSKGLLQLQTYSLVRTDGQARRLVKKQVPSSISTHFPILRAVCPPRSPLRGRIPPPHHCIIIPTNAGIDYVISSDEGRAQSK